ncbi:LysR family transcriptional regulator [Snodgrassella sp. CFCC 13594]|uniref:LysR family transcriptional regulator n=1 Tax=Snodgrassella sp. CFCC 13594 TaxID=1775559 RepID=UPI0008359EBE|nr:LysR family transcriptional regulator [Snodgrassella sp. CFCC 13594]
MLDDLDYFTHIVHAGSFNTAAQQIGTSAATLTRRLQKLEQVLGCKLIIRHARGIKLTPEGRRYYDACLPLLSALNQTTQDLHAHITQPAGKIRVLAPINLAVTPLAEFWPLFLQTYPDIELELILDNRNDKLLAQGADVALRAGHQADSTLIQKRLTSTATAIVAAPSYLSQHPKIIEPTQLKSHRWLVATPLNTITFQRGTETQHFSIPSGRFAANEIRLCVQLAASGLGLAYLPVLQCQAELASGLLQRVMTEWQSPPRHVYAVWPAQSILPARVRVLVDALTQYFKQLDGI